ncbi:hypothetical protein FB384_004956 [Prauserella sediminis]|uniref:Uncharacterized protein n=1 Tax=Prauserella sediminis TaxID=577680 RepID=A0A839XTE1_9PSEU|nr:hypothetical protein [Prauserella sediminis]MBB3665997.1 hypothetical protein [Prauserella sediminis]
MTVTSSPANEHESTIYLADLAAVIALDSIGRSLTRTLPRSERHPMSRVRCTDTWDRHRLFNVPEEQVDRLLETSVRPLDHVMPPDHCLRTSVEEYVRTLVRTRRRHQRSDLVEHLTRSGCLADE